MKNCTVNKPAGNATKNGYVASASTIYRSFVVSLIVLGFMTACSPAKEEVAPQANYSPAVTETSATATARIQISTDAIDVRTFGAKGDGLTDDTEAIRKALKSCKQGQVVFQAGIYKISQVIKIETSNVALVGLGAVKLQSSERGIMELGNVSNVSFTNLIFESVSRDGATYYYGLVYSNKKVITNVSFTGCTFTGPFCSTTGIKLITDAIGSSVAQVRVDNCTFSDLGTMGIEIQNHLHDGVERFTQVEVRNSTFRNLGLNENAAYHYGMAVSCSGMGSEVVIAGNTIINPYDLGIELAGAVRNGQILNNQFSGLTRMNKEGNRPVAIIAISSSKGDMHENIKIIGNQNLETTSTAYLFIGNIETATVENNTFNTQWPVQVRNVSNSTFSNNQINSRGSSAVLVESTDLACQNNQFVNSTFSCTASADAIVKFNGAKTVSNVIRNSQLTRRTGTTKYMVEMKDASGNTLKECT